MKTLSKEDIAFVNRYLENSDVIFADIRMEMVDHIASDIESKMLHGDKRSFREIFKDYMQENKLRLLENKRTTINQLTKTLAKRALSKLILMPFILGLAMVSILYVICLRFIGIEQTVWIHLIANLSLILVPAMLYEYYRRKKRISRFSGVERIGLMLGILTQMIFFTRNISSLYSDSFHLLLAVIFSVQLIITIAFLSVGVEQFGLYKKNFT